MKMRLVKFITVIFFTIFFSAAKTFSQSNDACLECHSDPAITMDKNGKTISLTVKKFVLARSPHAKLKCVDCHEKFDADAVPHKEKIEPINCINCHKNVAERHPYHPTMAKNIGKPGEVTANCKNCHGKHDVVSPKNPSSRFYRTKLTVSCGACHKEEADEQAKSEHHFAESKKNETVPTCIYCHSKAVTKGYDLPEAQLKLNQERLCLDCHLNNPNVKSTFAKTLVKYESSVHGSAILKGKKEAATCIDCHGAHNLQKAEAAESKINQFNVPKLCGKCHVSISMEYTSSIHGTALMKYNPDAPGCTYCHGEHDIKPLPDVPPRVFEESHIKHSTVVRNKMVFCIACHADEKLMKKYKLNTVAKAHDWLPNKASHWETVRCVDCHSSYAPPNLSHNILPPEKTIKKCEECHTQNSVLMAKLYKHEKQTSREKFGWINGVLLSNAYVVGSTRNVLLETMSIVIAALVMFGAGFHGLLRWYFKRGGK
ncbi:MAG: hypothetical protein HW421_1105 [Ignavibacteria bacterium]|nr:hypothetical protein [Ignavibacteria bacterium]